MALRGRREPPSQSDGLGGPSYRFPQIVTALSIYCSGYCLVGPLTGGPFPCDFVPGGLHGKFWRVLGVA